MKFLIGLPVRLVLIVCALLWLPVAWASDAFSLFVNAVAAGLAGATAHLKQWERM